MQCFGAYAAECAYLHTVMHRLLTIVVSALRLHLQLSSSGKQQICYTGSVVWLAQEHTPFEQSVSDFHEQQGILSDILSD